MVIRPICRVDLAPFAATAPEALVMVLSRTPLGGGYRAVGRDPAVNIQDSVVEGLADESPLPSR